MLQTALYEHKQQTQGLKINLILSMKSRYEHLAR
jgi:hypothetical protein